QQVDGPVYLIDRDPQGTMTIWHQRRQAEFPAMFENALDIDEALALAAKRGARYVFIDTPAGLRDEPAEAIYAHADLVLVPSRPSYSDVWAAGETVKTLKAHGKPFMFIANFVKPHTNMAAEIVAMLSKHGPVAEVLIPDRVLYASAFKTGR